MHNPHISSYILNIICTEQLKKDLNSPLIVNIHLLLSHEVHVKNSRDLLELESIRFKFLHNEKHNRFFSEALPIPIMWINNDICRRLDTDGSLNSKNTKPIKKSSNKEVIKVKEVKSEDKVYFTAPGCLGNSWTGLEKEAFLLCLYIFGKKSC